MNETDRMRILLVYPDTFTDAEHLMNKVATILRNRRHFKLIYSGNSPGMAEACAERLGCEVELSRGDPQIQASDVTHAIVFDAGDDGAIGKCRALGVPYRRIPVVKSTVANVDKGEDYDVYIGRGSLFGNPYALGVDGDREEVIRKFEYDFHRGLLTDRKTGAALKDLALVQLRGKVLGCHCKPAACHGDVIARFVNQHG